MEVTYDGKVVMMAYVFQNDEVAYNRMGEEAFTQMVDEAYGDGEVVGDDDRMEVSVGRDVCFLDNHVFFFRSQIDFLVHFDSHFFLHH